MKFETSIGLEIHIQLLTESKLFCGCLNKYGCNPNTNICQVCAGLPGALPVLNKKAVEVAVMTAFILGLKIMPEIKFSRKNYFYPDLPKGYQISQFDAPVAIEGYLEIKTGQGVRKVGISSLHLEEDAGKLIHGLDPDKNEAGFIDYNRAGVPLIEIVSKPDLKSSEEAAVYLRTLRSLVRYLGVCDGNMEEGSLRCDVNVSLHKKGAAEPGTRVEIKNLNSVRHMVKAVEFERQRQLEIIELGRFICQETCLWDEKKKVTVLMRKKEYLDDYRYFPDPDIPGVKISEELMEGVKSDIPELQLEKINRFVRDYELSFEQSEHITETSQMADYFEETVRLNCDPLEVCNWLKNIIRSKLADLRKIADFPFKPEDLSQLIGMVDNGTITQRTAKNVFDDMLESGKSAKEVVVEKGLFQICDQNEINKIVQEYIDNHTELVDDYKRGREKLLSFFIGQIMNEAAGRLNLQTLKKILRKRLLNG